MGPNGLPGPANGGPMLGTPGSCIAAVLNRSVSVYLTDTPMLNWVANAFLDSAARQFYVSPPLQTNPLVWAYNVGRRGWAPIPSYPFFPRRFLSVPLPLRRC